MRFREPIDRRRKLYSIPIQVKYTAILTLVAGFMSLVMIFVMAFFIQRNYNLFMGDELGVSAQVIEVVRREQKILEISLFILFLFSITSMAAVSLYVTRRLTGPIVALERHLLHLCRGDWSRTFRLRKDDEFRELERIVNQLKQNHFTAGPKRDAAV